MPIWEGRAILRGAEVETLDLIAQVLTWKQWAELLKAPLERAVSQGNRSLARKLVRSGADTRGALHAAVRGDHGTIVTDLLDGGSSLADKDTAGDAPLHLASKVGTSKMVQLLLRKGADKDALNNKETTPLFLAAIYGNMGAALALLDAGADANVTCGEDNESAVHRAVGMGRVDILRAMIKHGADVNAGDTSKLTPLHQAVSGHQVEAIGVLIQAGANIEARSLMGCTPLHLAAVNRNAEAVLTLLREGADVNAQEEANRTPLHSAATKAGALGAAEIVDLLLRSGVDETIVDNHGKTAADVIGEWFTEDEEEHFLQQHDEDVARVRGLLANAPADRAWRRRGYLVLCRAHPNRVRHGQERSSGQVGMARRTRRGAQLAGAEGGRGGGKPGHGTRAQDNSAMDWAVVVASVLGLEEEGIFRTIVGYL